MQVTELFRDLLISVTSFFRDKESFQLLEQRIVPAIFADKLHADEVRVWVPGCATGEEAYSLGILLLEYADRLGDAAPAMRIFATDIDENALSIARKGRYPSALMTSVTEERRKRFFIDDHDHFTVHKRLREVCTFSMHNALRDPPLSRMDLVSCRNLLIYLGQEFQDRILPIMHYALRPDGFLFLGVAQGVSRNSSLFKPISKEGRLFQRLPSPDGNGALPLLTGGPHARSTTRQSTPTFAAPGPGHANTCAARSRRASWRRIPRPTYCQRPGRGDVLLRAYRRLPGISGRRPQPPSAEQRAQGTSPGLRRALHEATTSQQRVELPDTTSTPMAPRAACRSASNPSRPLRHRALSGAVFRSRAAPAVPQNLAKPPSRSRDQLERELADTREQLQSTVRGIRDRHRGAAGQPTRKCMSVNEELQSTNEELETSKEELQSVNEELQTVNGEWCAPRRAGPGQRGIDRFAGKQRDRHDFRGPQLVIRRFTQAATDIFTLIPSDCGRLITDLASQLKDFDARDILLEAMEKHTAIEQSLSRKDDSKHFLMRALPYVARTPETVAW